MRIIMDGMPLLGRKTGIGYYVENLYNNLSRFNELNLELLCNGIGFSKSVDVDNYTLRKAPFPYDLYRTKSNNKLLYNTFQIETFIGRFDVFHGTNYVLLPTRRAKKVVTIHDLSFIKHPEFVPKSIVDHHTEWSKYAANESDLIIVDSFSTGKDLQEYFGVKESKIVCIHLAASSNYCLRKPENVEYIRGIYGLPSKFILFVGTIEMRKNVINMIKAYAEARNKYQIEHKLVLIGGKGLGYDEVLHTVTQLKLENYVLFPGYIKENDLPKIYNLASLFIYISIYEGFGLPVLEAMQSGIPVITSNCSSLPEVVEQAGIQTDPYDVNEIALEIARVIQDEEIRSDLIAKGLKQAAKFSWESTASKTYEVYKGL
ncbi:glycosyltransferase family 1 protein [Paenibacillus lautus]|jgi:glycosyltransferase involved in cell wall biosynthesis|uniref:glycosyltransferase family 4 protein n=1 Tax=Paenibacillus lautus TaxID=1401 RepID=UPI0010D919E3|nr:group 1 glycosyl transferase [Actinobacillus pleuropneumoniae]